MYKSPFYIGNFISCFVPGSERRHRVRGWVNVVLYYIPIKMLIRRVYGVPVKKIKFVRQITLNRMACVVNDKYYVKVFRNVSQKQVANYKYLLDFIRSKVNVNIPKIYVAKHNSFNKSDVLKHESEIKKQVFDVIKSLQKIPFDSIIDNERYKFSMQPQRAKEKPYHKDISVLAHFDLNETNILFDDKYNIISIIDWDSLSMAKNPNTDKEIFLKYWTRYKTLPTPK